MKKREEMAPDTNQERGEGIRRRAGRAAIPAWFGRKAMHSIKPNPTQSNRIKPDQTWGKANICWLALFAQEVQAFGLLSK